MNISGIAFFFLVFLMIGYFIGRFFTKKVLARVAIFLGPISFVFLLWLEGLSRFDSPRYRFAASDYVMPIVGGLFVFIAIVTGGFLGSRFKSHAAGYQFDKKIDPPQAQGQRLGKFRKIIIYTFVFFVAIAGLLIIISQQYSIYQQNIICSGDFPPYSIRCPVGSYCQGPSPLGKECKAYLSPIFDIVIGIVEEIPVEPSGEPNELSFQKVALHTDWRLKESYDHSIYRGIFRAEAGLKNTWKYMINAYDEVSGLPFPRNPNQPVMPEIDFDKYSVVWYADRGSNASFVTMSKIVEYQNFLEAHLSLFYSDFGSSHLNLWIIPKTEKKIRFIETKEYDRGP